MPTARPWRSRLAAAKLPLLLLYGVAAFAFAVMHFNSALPDDVRLMETRIEGIDDSLNALSQGGPPLLGCEGRYEDSTAALRQRCFPTGTTDDQGVYLYLPLIGKLAGETEPPLLLKWLFTWLMSVTVLVAPILFATLFRSTLVGLLAPLPLISSLDFLQDTDIYWIPAWAILMCLPLVLLAYDRERWDRAGTGLLIVAVAIGGFASSIRSHAGLPILVAAVLVVFLRSRRWRARSSRAAALALAYIVTSSLVLTIAREYRDHSTGIDFSGSARTTHPFWHSMYLGLGYLPNAYGIEWNDTVAFDAVLRERPGTEYLSPEYELTLRGLYIDIVRDKPGFVARTYDSKLRALFSQVKAEYGLALLLIPAMALLGRNRRRNRTLLLLTLPALAITLLPPVLTLPNAEYGYNVGWLATVGFTCFLAAAWAIAAGQRGLTAFASTNPRSLRWNTVRPRLQEGLVRGVVTIERKRLTLLAAGVALALVVLALALTSADAEPRIEYAGQATPLIPDADLEGAPVTTWDFDAGAPAGWEPLEGASLTPTSEGTKVTTTEGVSEYQLVSGAIKLDPGRYRVELKGVVRAGGLELGALDATANAWLSQSRFWSGQNDFESSLMTLPLRLDRSTKLQIVLANWNAGDASEWTIHNLRLVRE